MKLPLSALGAAALLASLSVTGCAAHADPPADQKVDPEAIGDTSEALTTACTLSRSEILASVSSGRMQAIERGFAWYDDRVPYSQSRSHEGYRTDCSGFVSMCWELGTSFTTASFASGGAESGPLSSYSKLVPGDALVHRSHGSGHIVLFLGWNDDAESSACVLEEASTALDMQFRARTTESLHASGYKPIRADKF